MLVVDVWHPLLATQKARAAVLDAPRALRYEAILRTGTFERAVETAAAPAAAHGAGVVPAAGVARHCTGLHGRVLGAVGMRTLEACAAAVLAGQAAGGERELV